MARKKQKTTPRALRQIERDARALQLRLKGWSYEKIAEELEESLSTAYDRVSRYLRKKKEECTEISDEVRSIELQRLDKMVAALEPQAEAGDKKAIDTLLRVLERRSRYLGLDLPSKVDVTSGDEPVQFTVKLDS